MKVVTDGEFRRGSYWGRFVERIDGFEIKPASFKFRNDQGHEVEFTAPYAKSKIKRRQALALDEYLFLRDVTKVTGKITLPAPSTMHFYRCDDFAAPSVYANAETFFADLAAIFRQEMGELAAAGCRYIQLDEVAVALLCDPGNPRPNARLGQRIPIRWSISISTASTRPCRPARPRSLSAYTCAAEISKATISAGGYESVAERFFANTKINHFLLEYDTPRAGDFAPLRFVPKTKGVVLGLISSKTAGLEGMDLLKRRIEEATRHIDLDRLAISPQCGFASTVAGNPLTEADERAKLALVVEAATAIWS